MAIQKFDSTIDYYSVLGVEENATQHEVDQAFRKQARLRHPDGGGSDEAMKSLNEAHDILRDAETRNAYDLERRPKRASYPSPPAFDPEAASRAGTLKIPVSDPDFAGLVMGAIACFGVGIPLLLLVEFQWMFILWPLKIMALGALVFGVYLSHSALMTWQRKRRNAGQNNSRRNDVIRELLFWLIMVGTIGSLLIGLYVLR